MASQQDVAKLANVSYMTVSRVVNGSDKVKKETRERVLAAIEELSYYPNAAARALNKMRTNNIGIILPKKEYLVSAPFYMELLLAFEIQLRKSGYNLFLGSMHDEGQKDYSLLFKEGKVDGLIVFAPSRQDPALEKLVQENIPFVVVLGRSGRSKCSFVDVDNIKSVATIINYFRDLGHRKIGFVSGNIHEFNAEERFIGYKESLLKHEILLDEKLIYYGDWSLTSGYNAFKRFYALDSPPTAIFCSNDFMAMGVIKAAQDFNVSIPENLSIIGFDDLQYSSFITPSLTTMRQPLEQIAEEASRIIINRINDPDAGFVNSILQSSFIIRHSCSDLIKKN